MNIMPRIRGFGFRGGSGRSWNNSDRSRSSYGFSPRGSLGSGGSGRYPSTFTNSSYDFNRPTERYSTSRHDDYPKSYRMDSTSHYSSRDHRSPERKRMRSETSSSHRSHDGFGGSNEVGYGGGSSARRSGGSGGYPPPERRSYSRERDRHSGSSSYRETFRKPSLLSSPRGSYRGGGSDRPLRGVRGSRMRGSGGPLRINRRIIDSSSGRGGGGGLSRHRRMAAIRSAEIARKIKISKIRRVRAAIARRRGGRDHRIRMVSPKDEMEIKSEKVDDEKSENDESEKTTKKEDSKSEKVKVKEEKRSENEKDDEETDATSPRRKDFIKLICPHCNARCITFGKYSMHLSSNKHIIAMRRIASKQKSILSRMRTAQRNSQREIEKSADDLTPRTNFCTLCKLNYKQPKTKHQTTEAHKNMKKFLMPYCNTCHITFKSPIAFETHLCSIEHIKRKARSEINGIKSENESDNDGLENFMTIDSVGELDEETPQEKKTEKEIPEKSKEKINIGIEHITKAEVHYCELCKMYLYFPRKSGTPEYDLDNIFSKHCRQRIHMQRYIRYKEDKEIQSRAEKLQRKETAEKENKEKKVKDNNGDEEKKEKVKPNDAKNEAAVVKEDEKKDVTTNNDNQQIFDDENDDKLWADVDKDLGDILREVEDEHKSSDEEEDINKTDRYDRYTEKSEENVALNESDVIVKEEVVTSNPITIEDDAAVDKQ